MEVIEPDRITTARIRRPVEVVANAQAGEQSRPRTGSAGQDTLTRRVRVKLIVLEAHLQFGHPVDEDVETGSHLSHPATDGDTSGIDISPAVVVGRSVIVTNGQLRFSWGVPELNHTTHRRLTALVAQIQQSLRPLLATTQNRRVLFFAARIDRDEVLRIGVPGAYQEPTQDFPGVGADFPQTADIVSSGLKKRSFKVVAAGLTRAVTLRALVIG